MVGAGTRRLLNQGQRPHDAGSPARIQQILVNMERWRWLPHDLGPFYVTVNIPEFTLRVMKDGAAVHTARVVVGKPDKQTPIFSDEMEEIVFNPYWNVPNSIKNEEIAPYFAQGGGLFGGGWDTSILQRHGLQNQIWRPHRRSQVDRLEPQRPPQFRSRSAARTQQRARPGKIPVPQRS